MRVDAPADVGPRRGPYELVFDWVYDPSNRQVPLTLGGNPIDRYNIVWTRMAMFF